MLDKVKLIGYTSQVKLLYKEKIMQIDKHNTLVRLFDIYGNLLSNRQYEVIDKILNCDISTSELAELEGESRQSIHDAINKAQKQLYTFEEKCNILKKYEEISEKLRFFKENLKTLDTEQLSHQIDVIIDKLN